LFLCDKRCVIVRFARFNRVRDWPQIALAVRKGKAPQEFVKYHRSLNYDRSCHRRKIKDLKVQPLPTQLGLRSQANKPLRAVRFQGSAANCFDAK
jgi:hypothetical protein